MNTGRYSITSSVCNAKTRLLSRPKNLSPTEDGGKQKRIMPFAMSSPPLTTYAMHRSRDFSFVNPRKLAQADRENTASWPRLLPYVVLRTNMDWSTDYYEYTGRFSLMGSHYYYVPKRSHKCVDVICPSSLCTPVVPRENYSTTDSTI